MNLVNAEVQHSKLGKGIVIEQTNDRITIQFSTKVSIFVYPESFETYLSVSSPKVQEEIMQEVKKINRENREKVEQQKGNTNVRDRLDRYFDEAYHVAYLARHPILTYEQVEDQFHIRIANFGRGINITDTSIVLISSVLKKKNEFVYHDHWTENGDYIYSGEGKT